MYVYLQQICDPLMPDRILLGVNCARIILVDAVAMVRCPRSAPSLRVLTHVAVVGRHRS